MTLGLSMITNDADATIKILEKYGHLFDKWFITVADKDRKQYKILDEWVQSKPADTIRDNVLSYFKWEDHFGKAREFNRQQIDTDYWFWMDSDDDLEGATNLRLLAQYMQETQLDVIYALYDYSKNELGEGIADHWRERLIRTKWAGKWAERRAHETVIAPNGATEKTDQIVVKHKKTTEGILASLERNHKLLELDFEETKDPRTAHYLGLSYMNRKEWDKSIDMFLYLIQNGGWDEERYRSWVKIAEIHYLNNNYQKALSACDGALSERPDYPEAYYLKTMIYADLDENDKAVEWVKMALTKKRPDTLSIVDPTLFEYRGMFLAALAYLKLGKVKEAWTMYNAVIQQSPDYPIAKEMKSLFEEAYYDKEAIDRLKWLMYYLKENNGDPVALLQKMPTRLIADPRLNVERAKFLPVKKWAKGSIAYFCGQAAETWGADTLDKGMGGSEEAVVYLSRELAKLGHQVTVFNDREEEYEDFVDTESVVGNSVEYQPWTLLNPNDEFDTFIAWRAPENARGVKARKVFVDLHDVVEPERVYNCAEFVDKYFVKSQYHRSLYPDLPDDKFVVIGNGIVKEQFND